MTVDIQEIKERYAAMPDEDFRAVTRCDLTEAARLCYDEELARRDPKRLQEVQQHDAVEAQRRARVAAADAQDPEPQPAKLQWGLTVMALLVTAVALTSLVLHAMNDQPVAGSSYGIVALTWIPVWTSHMSYRRAKTQWEARRREAGLL
jgi:hypothetical protein